eukprot:GEZU01029414.1.p1 GENE.GEZU01029414.1~~GEZU01029414.1.p1  ORF type:complete len:237 (+),score=67.82 GEZU01029414.1:25-735(+)
MSKTTKIRIGYQGAEGSNNEMAARAMTTESNKRHQLSVLTKADHHDHDIEIELLPLFSSVNVVQALLRREIQFGVMAIHNTLGGNVEESQKALEHLEQQLQQRYDNNEATYLYKEVDRIRMQINHCLFKHPMAANDRITTVASHEQALRQCTNSITARFGSDVRRLPTSDTAMAARILALSARRTSTKSESGGDIDYRNTAVICSKRAGEMNGLELLFEGFQDNPENFTTFVMIML